MNKMDGMLKVILLFGLAFMYFSLMIFIFGVVAINQAVGIISVIFLTISVVPIAISIIFYEQIAGLLDVAIKHLKNHSELSKNCTCKKYK